MKEEELEYIEWCDAIVMKNGWYSKDDVKYWGENEDWKVKQVGYLIEENENYILLATKYNPQEDGDDRFSEITKIPKTWILKRANVSLSFS